MLFGRFGEQAAQLAQDGLAVRRLVNLCQRVLSERGEVGGATLARTALDAYAALDAGQKSRFFHALDREFAPDPGAILKAAQTYDTTRSAADLIALQAIAEPPRQELLRRLNRVPGGTRGIVRMRRTLLELLAKDEGLSALDYDFQHILTSWFNPGFLRIERVDWHTPAMILEQIIAHEAVHEIQGWDDLHRRLEADRRCFAFFHPVLPDEPLIFIEIALTEGISSAIGPLIDIKSQARPAVHADTAMFYSISNCEPGLRGVSLGNFLIKRVVDLLSGELPRLRRFCTLSPIPGFARWLARSVARPDLQARDSEVTDRLRRDLASVQSALGDGVARLAEGIPPPLEALQPARAPLERVCAVYLMGLTSDNVPVDPVARFHLNNGARIERLNWAADPSPRGMKQSLGLMVNYLYDRRSIEANHERFVAREGIAASGEVRALAKP
jgi:malonyl-CoA decarboxylase